MDVWDNGVAGALSRFLAFALVGLGASAQGTVLNDPLPAGIAGDVTGFALAPDAQRAVYAADQEVDGTVGLYAVPLGGGASVVLDPAIAFTGSGPGFGQTFHLTPDAQTVVYVDRILGSALSSVPIGGGAPPTSLSGPGWVERFYLSSDSERVVFVTGVTWQGPFELLAVPVAGGDPTSLSGPLPAYARVGAVQLAPDGRRVAYVVDQDTDEAYELYGAAIDGSARVELSVPLVPGEDVLDFQIAPDSKRVVYQTQLGGAVRLLVTSLAGGASLELATVALESYQLAPDGHTVVFLRAGALFGVATSGGPVVPLSAPLAAPQHVDQFVFTSDSKRVVYRVGDGMGETSTGIALYAVRLDGGVPTLIARPPGRFVARPLISPDARCVVYTLYDYTGFDETWSAPLAGGPAVRLANEELYFAAIDPGSSRLVYVAARRISNPQGTILELHAVPLAGGPSTRLSGPLIEQGNVLILTGPAASPAVTPDGARVLYLADQEHDEVLELYSVPLAGGPVVRLNPDLVRGGTAGDVERVEVSPDGAYVLYRADQVEDDVFELWSVRLPAAGAPAGAPVRLNGALGRNGDVVRGGFRVSPDSRRAVFATDAGVDGIVEEIAELFSVPIEGGPAVRLDARIGRGSGAGALEISPDSRFVAFQNDPDEPFRAGLFSVPLEGGANVELSAGIPDLDIVSTHAISADSRRVVFVALHGAETATELYSVPIEGGPLVRLNPTPVPGGRVGQFRILPDASGVVYVADLERDDVNELYLVALEGGASVKLSGASIALGDVEFFTVSADARHVVYRADPAVNNLVELFAVRLADGARVRLNPPLVADGDVHGFVIAPDGARVVYSADQATNDVFELFSVPIEGGAATRLSGPMVSGGDVDFLAEVLVSPGSERVVYRADQERNGVLELYSVPLTGGTAAKLNGPLAIGENVARDFALALDGRAVVFRAGREPIVGSWHFELFRAPIEGGQPPERLNGPLADYGSVTPSDEDFRSFRVAGRHVLYRADQSEHATFELHLSTLREAGRARRR